jgi:hypothetical protein
MAKHQIRLLKRRRFARWISVNIEGRHPNTIKPIKLRPCPRLTRKDHERIEARMPEVEAMVSRLIEKLNKPRENR